MPRARWEQELTTNRHKTFKDDINVLNLGGGKIWMYNYKFTKMIELYL